MGSYSLEAILDSDILVNKVRTYHAAKDFGCSKEFEDGSMIKLVSEDCRFHERFGCHECGLCYEEELDTFFCDASISQYIRFGTECPICYDPVNFAKNAWITPCNHVYHKTCLARYMNTTGPEYMSCPLCRQEAGYLYYMFPYDRMYLWKKVHGEKVEKRYNGLDMLQHLELYGDSMDIDWCEAPDDRSWHVLGSKRKTCQKCYIWAYGT